MSLYVFEVSLWLTVTKHFRKLPFGRNIPTFYKHIKDRMILNTNVICIQVPQPFTAS